MSIIWLPFRKAKGDGQQRMRWLDSITNSTDKNLSKFWEIVGNREALSTAIHGVAKSWTWLRDWTTTGIYCIWDTVWMCGVLNSGEKAPPDFRKTLLFDVMLIPYLLAFPFTLWSIQSHLQFSKILCLEFLFYISFVKMKINFIHYSKFIHMLVSWYQN